MFTRVTSFSTLYGHFSFLTVTGPEVLCFCFPFTSTALEADNICR